MNCRESLAALLKILFLLLNDLTLNRLKDLKGPSEKKTFVDSLFPSVDGDILSSAEAKGNGNLSFLINILSAKLLKK